MNAAILIQSLLCYEDSHCLVVAKPFGMLVHSDETGDPSLEELVREYIRLRFDKPGKAYIGLVHRLDRPVGGLVLMARNSKAAARLSRQFQRRTVRKTYTAVVKGCPENLTQRLEHGIFKPKGQSTVLIRDTAGGDYAPAVLSYTVSRCLGEVSILEVQLETGRPHQIRAQLAAIGHPILGDLRYGSGETLPDGRIGLFAHRLEFGSVVGGQRIQVEQAAPLLEMLPTRLHGALEEDE